MGNMSYCRFENTLSALQDCNYHFLDDDLSSSEAAARKRLLELCREIAEQEENEEGDEE